MPTCLATRFVEADEAANLRPLTSVTAATHFTWSLLHRIFVCVKETCTEFGLNTGMGWSALNGRSALNGGNALDGVVELDPNTIVSTRDAVTCGVLNTTGCNFAGVRKAMQLFQSASEGSRGPQGPTCLGPLQPDVAPRPVFHSLRSNDPSGMIKCRTTSSLVASNGC